MPTLYLLPPPPRTVLRRALGGLALLLAACGGAREDGPRLAPDEPWFRREASRPDPEPPPAPPIVKKELPPGAKDRPPAVLPAIPAAPDTEDSKFHAWKPGSSSDTITLEPGQAGFTLEGATVQGSARTAIIAYQGKGPYVGTTLRDCVIVVEPDTVPDGRAFWGIRGYDMEDTTLSGVEITGFGKVTPKHDEGHAVYLNVSGELTLEDCNIHHNGGQGLQLVNRPYESNRPKGPAKGAITVRRTWFHENGFNPDRGGFQVSIFGTGQDVTLEQVSIVAGRDATSYDKGMTGGGLLIEAEGPRSDKDNCWWWPLPKDADGPPFSNGRVVLDGVEVDHVNPNRPIAQLKGCKELAVTGCTFNGGKVVLDDPSKAGRASGRITWKGNQGDAVVFLAGERIGTVDQDFTAVNGVLQ